MNGTIARLVLGSADLRDDAPIRKVLADSSNIRECKADNGAKVDTCDSHRQTDAT